MKNVDARLINLEKVNFVEDGEVKSTMTKIVYCMKCDELDTFRGKAIFECYSSEKSFELLKKFVETNETVKLDIILKPLKNGAKYILNSVNGIALRS